MLSSGWRAAKIGRLVRLMTQMREGPTMCENPLHESTLGCPGATPSKGDWHLLSLVCRAHRADRVLLARSRLRRRLPLLRDG